MTTSTPDSASSAGAGEPTGPRPRGTTPSGPTSPAEPTGDVVDSASSKSTGSADSAASEPATSASAASEPATSDPAASEPATSEPTASAASASDSTSAAPAATAAPTRWQSQLQSPLVVVLLLVIAALLAVIITLLLTRPTTAPQSTPSPTSSASAVQTSAPTVTDSAALEILHSEVKRDPSDAQAQGKVDAPVVMVLYSDFGCPYCTLLAQRVEPQLADLVSNGTLRIEWRDLAQITPTSPMAAQAGVAAANQGRFWEFHNAVYAAADPSDHPAYTEDSLVEFARTAGVADLERFRTDMLSQEVVAQVQASTQHAHSIGINGTPFMIINDTFIAGYQDAAYVRATVLDQAAQAGKGK